MSSPRASSARVLDRALSRLPEHIAVAHRGPDRLMTGPGGAFVLHPLEPDELARDAVEHAHLLAQTTRDRIAGHLAWVPFVDWFVVDDGDRHEISVLPTSLVATTVLEGHAMPLSVADELRRYIALGGLNPLWHQGLPVAGDHLIEVTTQMHPLG